MFYRRKSKIGVEPLQQADAALSQMVNNTQAVIHFLPDGTILDANKNFLDVLGYDLEEVVGEKHAMFVDKDHRNSQDYADFWENLRCGTAFSSRVARLHKNGSSVYIQATYAPIWNEAGQVVRVIKIATDVTPQEQAIQSIIAGLTALNNGQLGHRVEISDTEEFHDVTLAFNEAMSGLSKMVTRIKDLGSRFHSSATHVHTASQDLSRRSERQALAIKETVAAIEAINATAISSANQATETNEIMQKTYAATDQSRDVMNNVTESMQRIKTSSDKITDILSLIDDIAFQTNLLALNAGVEAARAGEMGRGFAVVAAEVRELAMKSAESAQQVRHLLEESTDNVQSGSEMVSRAEAELLQAFSGIGDMSEKIQAVAQDLSHQAVSLEEISAAVSEINQVTQKNATMVHQTSQTSDQLRDGATALLAEVDAYTTKQNSDQGGLSVPPAASTMKRAS